MTGVVDMKPDQEGVVESEIGDAVRGCGQGLFEPAGIQHYVK